MIPAAPLVVLESVEATLWRGGRPAPADGALDQLAAPGNGKSGAVSSLRPVPPPPELSADPYEEAIPEQGRGT